MGAPALGQHLGLRAARRAAPRIGVRKKTNHSESADGRFALLPSRKINARLAVRQLDFRHTRHTFSYRMNHLWAVKYISIVKVKTKYMISISHNNYIVSFCPLFNLDRPLSPSETLATVRQPH